MDPSANSRIRCDEVFREQVCRIPENFRAFGLHRELQLPERTHLSSMPGESHMD